MQHTDLTFDSINIYVDDIDAGVAFYKTLLGKEPTFGSPTFSAFDLGSGIVLGLLSRRAEAHAPTTRGAEGEIDFKVARPDQVDSTCAAWRERGIIILQEPEDMPFGRTFTAVDPEGHRLRVYAAK